MRVETEDDLTKRLNAWKDNVENRGIEVNMNKTKVIISGEHQKVRWLCDVCGRGVGNNSIQCTSCQKWVNTKGSGIKSSMYKVMSFICRGLLLNMYTNSVAKVSWNGACSIPFNVANGVKQQGIVRLVQFCIYLGGILLALYRQQ